MPTPPRTTKRPSLTGCQANPKRGPKLSYGGPDLTGRFLLDFRTPAGTGPWKFAGTTKPAKVPPEVGRAPLKGPVPCRAAGVLTDRTWLCQTLVRFPYLSLRVPSYSQRTPRLSVNRGLILKSSCTNALMLLAR